MEDVMEHSKINNDNIKSQLYEEEGVEEGEVLSFLLSSAPIFSSKASQKLPSSISNLIASTSASSRYCEIDSSSVLQIIYKTSYCFLVRFIFQLLKQVLRDLYY